MTDLSDCIREIIERHRVEDLTAATRHPCDCGAEEPSDHSRHVAQEIVASVSEVAAAGSLPALPGRGSYIALGVISVIVGVVVLVWPFDSIVLLAIVTGVCLALIGAIQIVQAFQIRREARATRQTLDAVSERAAA